MYSRHRDLRRAGALKVLLIVLGVIFGGSILICAGCLTLAYFKGKPLAAEVFRQMAVVPLDAGELPQEQKDRIRANVDRVVNGVKTGQIGYVQLGEMMSNLSEGPYFNLAIIELARGQVATLLKPEEKRWKEATRVIDRFERGVYEGRIPASRIDTVLSHVSAASSEGNREAKSSLTEVEAEDFLEAALKEANRAKIPDEPFHVDLAGELQRCIDKVLVGGGTTSGPARERSSETAPSGVESDEKEEPAGR